MGKFKYKCASDVANAIQTNKIKRNSLLVMKRQYKRKGELEYSSILQEGVTLYDQWVIGRYHCSYYDKNIDNLTLYELVKLDEDKPSLFSHYHKVRYSILMLGSTCTVAEYKGVIITPVEFENF